MITPTINPSEIIATDICTLIKNDDGDVGHNSPSFSKIKIRCSSLGAIMTDSRSKSESLSETCKAELINIFIESKYDREKDISNKYTEKGLMVEQDAITLYSRIKGRYFKKNEYRIHNEYLSGEPDMFIGESIMKADKIIDTKSAWDIWTFFKAKFEGYNKNYFWQMQGYMALTGAKEAELAYCLINTPDHMIEQEKQRLYYKLGDIDGKNSAAYLEGCKQIEHNSIFDDMPLADRMFTITIKREDEKIESMYERIRECRNWMNNNLLSLDEQLANSLKQTAI